MRRRWWRGRRTQRKTRGEPYGARRLEGAVCPHILQRGLAYYREGAVEPPSKQQLRHGEKRITRRDMDASDGGLTMLAKTCHDLWSIQIDAAGPELRECILAGQTLRQALNRLDLLPPMAREAVPNRAINEREDRRGPFCGHKPQNGPRLEMGI